MEVKVKSISINSPAVKINTELKTIDRPAPPEEKFIGAGNAICILDNIFFARFVNAEQLQEGE
jgi:hypothetical protein